MASVVVHMLILALLLCSCLKKKKEPHLELTSFSHPCTPGENAGVTSSVLASGSYNNWATQPCPNTCPDSTSERGYTGHKAEQNAITHTLSDTFGWLGASRHGVDGAGMWRHSELTFRKHLWLRSMTHIRKAYLVSLLVWAIKPFCLFIFFNRRKYLSAPGFSQAAKRLLAVRSSQQVANDMINMPAQRWVNK